MFKRINNKIFGAYLSDLRSNYNLSKISLAKQSGLTDETIRRLEKGENTPSFNTLNSLSKVLKVDLIDVYISMINNNDLNVFYKDLDSLIIGHNVTELNHLNDKFTEYEKKVYNENLEEIREVNQFRLILQGLELSINSEKGSLEAYNKYEDSIKLSIPTFSIKNIHENKYSYLELKCIFLMAMEKNAMENYVESNRISMDLFNYLDVVKVFDFEENMVLYKTKLYVNIAYNHHCLDDDEKAYYYSNKGIEYCVKNHSLYLLYALFYRRAVALFYLGKDSKQMKKDFLSAVSILDTYGMKSLKKIYVETTKNKYGIDLEIY